VDEDIQVKYGVAGSSPVFCGRGVRPLDGVAGSSPVFCGRGALPREGCCVERIINIHVK